MVEMNSGSLGGALTRRSVLRVTAIAATAVTLPTRRSAALARPSLDWATSLTAGEAVKRIAHGDITAEAYTAALLEQADRVQSLNIFLSQDRVALLQGARRIDLDRRAGRTLGPLAGVPLLVKDNIETAALPTTGGTPSLAGNRPTHDAATLHMLLGAGALLFGKTNMDELAMGNTGTNAATSTIHNPYAADRIPGGSSGGTAAGIAARVSPAGLGTDTAGSARTPASLCGIVGFRPSIARYSRIGRIPTSHTRDVIAPLARTAADVVLLDGVMSRKPAGGSTSLRGLRLGLPKADFWNGLDDETEAVAQEALRKMRAAGVSFVDVELPGLAETLAGIEPILAYEAIADLREYLRSSGATITAEQVVAGIKTPDVAAFYGAWLREGGDVDRYHAALDAGRPKLQALFADCFRQHGISALCFPADRVAATPIGQRAVMLKGEAVPVLFALLRNGNPASAAGLPGLVLPAGLSQSGLPVGLEFDGPVGSDADLLSIGLALETILPPLPAPSGA